MAEQWIDPDAFLQVSGLNQALWTPTTTLVPNLNADMLDGLHVGTSGAAIPDMSQANTWGGVQSFNAGIKASDGLVGTPSYSFINDPDTGFYRIGPNQMAWVSNGAVRLNLGVVTSTSFGLFTSIFPDSSQNGLLFLGGSANAFSNVTSIGFTAKAITSITTPGYTLSSFSSKSYSLQITPTTGVFTLRNTTDNRISVSIDAAGAMNLGTSGLLTTVNGHLTVVGNTTLATSLTGIVKATSGVIDVASSSDILTAIGTIDISANTNLAVTSPITLTGDTVGIQDAAADGTTKGAATFTAADFNSSSGLISIDYTNGQAASGSTKGFLTSADWTTFNNKVSASRTINTTSPITGGGDLSADRTIGFDFSTNNTWTGTNLYEDEVSIADNVKFYIGDNSQGAGNVSIINDQLSSGNIIIAPENGFGGLLNLVNLSAQIDESFSAGVGHHDTLTLIGSTLTTPTVTPGSTHGLVVRKSSTTAGNAIIGLVVDAEWAGSSSSANAIQGFNCFSHTATGTTGNLTNATGSGGLRARWVARQRGSGTIARMTACGYSVVVDASTGDVTDGFALNVEAPTISDVLTNYTGLNFQTAAITGSCTTAKFIDIPALTFGTNPYEVFFQTDAGSFYREGGNQINSRASGELDIDATTKLNVRIGGTVEVAINATQFDIKGNDLILAAGSKIYLEGAGSDTYVYYDSGSTSWKFYTNNVLSMELK